MGISDYRPIDYRHWILGDEARKGVNIKRLSVLRPEELELLEEFVPYQDQREDPGQAEWVTLHALKLLDFIPGKREVVVPAALAHDTGFFGYDPNYWKKLVASGGQTEGEVVRRPHQNRGIMVAGRVFEKVRYPSQEYHFEIADIIGDHDTRFLPTTESGRIVRAADYTWRVSLPCFEIYLKDKTPDEILAASEKNALESSPPFNLEHPEYEIARLEFANTLVFKFGADKARKVLLPKYEKELERAVEFYS